MAAEHTRAGRFKAQLGGLGLCGLIAAYFCAPLLRLCSPVLLLSAGVGLGGAAMILYQEWTANPAPTDRKSLLFYCFMAYGVVSLVWAAGQGIVASQSLDKVCGRAQAEMLGGRPPAAPAPKPGQADAKDLFQALGCRPQL